MPIFLILAVVLAVALLAVGLIVTLTTEKSLVDKRLESYLHQEKGTADIEPGEVEQAREAILTDWLTKQVEKTNMGDNIARELARADLKFKSGEYIAIIIISAIVTGIIGYFFGGASLIFGLIGLIVGMFIPRFFVKRAQKNRLRKFNDQLPDMLNLMVNGLRTGFSALQAMEAVSRELPAPISDEFRRVVQEMQLGVAMEGALNSLQRRIASDDLDLAVTAINIQREVGGNLAEILDVISYTIRERIRIQGEVRAVTAQVALSGRFLSLMPLILAVVLWGLNRDYMMQFFEEPITCGLSILILAGIMLVAGYFVLNRIGTIEI